MSDREPLIQPTTESTNSRPPLLDIFNTISSPTLPRLDVYNAAAKPASPRLSGSGSPFEVIDVPLHARRKRCPNDCFACRNVPLDDEGYLTREVPFHGPERNIKFTIDGKRPCGHSKGFLDNDDKRCLLLDHGILSEKLNYELSLYETLFLGEWNIPAPSLLLSVVGGLQNWKGEERIQKAFLRGIANLIKRTPNVWIVTDGVYQGISKDVGTAVSSMHLGIEQLRPGASKQITVLGIMPKNSTVDAPRFQTSEGTFWYNIRTDASNDAENRYIDPNHTHYIIVENSKNSTEPHPEQRFRNELEYFVAQYGRRVGFDNDIGDFCCPSVVVLLEGDWDCLCKVTESLERRIPCVIVKGSGRSADALIEASEKGESGLKDIAKKYLASDVHAHSMKIVCEKIKRCLEFKELWKVFEIDAGDTCAGLEAVILETIMQTSRNSYVENLDLALQWQRTDLAKRVLDTSGPKDVAQRVEDLKDKFIRVLVDPKGNMSFIVLFLESAGQKALIRSVTYDSLIERHLLRDGNGEILPQFRNWIRHSHWGSKKTVYVKSKESLLDPIFLKVLGTDYKRPRCEIGSSQTIDHYANLFVWSVLAGKCDFAHYLLEQPPLKYPIAAALVACNILRMIVKEGQVSTTFESQELVVRALEFEQLACDMLMTCYECSQYRTLFLLTQSIPAFGRTSCLQLALDGKCLNFYSLDPVQDHLTRLWFHMLSPQCGLLPIGLSCFVPPLAGKIVPFEEKKNEEEDTKQLIGRHPKLKEDLRSIGIDSGGDNFQNMSGWQRMKMRIGFFFETPVVKFLYNLIFYFLFLGIFATLILTTRPSEWVTSVPSVLEWIVFIYWASLNTNEIAQILAEDGITLAEKIGKHLYLGGSLNTWNIIDTMVLWMCVAAVISRAVLLAILDLEDKRLSEPSWHYLLHLLYVLIFMLCSIRLLQAFLLFDSLGPKLRMIKDMFQDFIQFLCIIAVFWITYGIGSQAVIQSLKGENYIKQQGWLDIITEPYWNLFGENIQDDNSFLETIYEKGSAESGESEGRVASRSISFRAGGGRGGHKSDSSNHDDGDWSTYPKFAAYFILSGMESIYLLFAVILLLNLIIALFSTTIAKIEEDSHKIWRFGRLELIYEYYMRPKAPEPFAFVLRITNKIWTFLRRNIRKPPKTGSGGRKITQAEMKSRMIKIDFENHVLLGRYDMPRENASRFLRMLRRWEKQVISYHFDKIKKRED